MKKYIGSIGKKTKALKGARPEEIEAILRDLSAETVDAKIRELIGGSA